MCRIPGAPVIQITVLAIILITMGIVLIRSESARKQKEDIAEMQEFLGEESSEAN
jgi:type III secretory pathway component EscV